MMEPMNTHVEDEMGHPSSDHPGTNYKRKVR